MSLNHRIAVVKPSADDREGGVQVCGVTICLQWTLSVYIESVPSGIEQYELGFANSLMCHVV